MSIFGAPHTLLTICSVLVGFVLMDSSTCLDHSSQNYDLRFGFFVFGSFKEIFGMLLLFALGFNSLYSLRFSRCSIKFLCGLRGKSRKSELGFYSENLLDGNLDSALLKDVPSDDTAEEITEKTNDFDEKYDAENDSDDHLKECTEGCEELEMEEDSESDVLALRKMVKIERRRANAAIAELVKERAASATAAEEAMAMILRLQHEKSSIEMEAKQYRRMAEEKQIHDEQVIESLEWLLWKNERELSLLHEELNGLLKSGECVEECC